MVSTIVILLSHVAKINSFHLFLAMVVIHHWPLHWLDIKNVFPHGDLGKEIYMEKFPRSVAQGECGLVCKIYQSLCIT